MLGASLQPMSEPGSSSCREGWTSWTVGRTKASSGLSAEEYGLILSYFDEHGPKKVEEEMRIPHKEDKLPQEPVLGNPNHSPPCCIHGCLAPCPNRAHHTHMLHPQRLSCNRLTLCAHSCACLYDTALSYIFPTSLL